MSWWVRWAVVPLVLLGCSSSPPPRIYVLGAAAAPVAGVMSESGRTTVELKPVVLPDYLDTTDILLRDGQNELKSSPTGHWGERLSVGVARALREDLTKRMPGILMVHADTVQPPSRVLLLNIDAFDIRADGRCVLAARWTILGEDNKSILASRQATIITDVPRSSGDLSDPAVVTAMAGAVEQLAGHIAADLSRTIRGNGR
jgi:uncharacterized lipoprotein YmbA